MKLDEHYTLEGEDSNWILNFKKATGEVNEKTGKPTYSRGKWYFPRIEQALKKYVDHALKPSESIKQVIAKQEEVMQVIEALTINPKERRRK